MKNGRVVASPLFDMLDGARAVEMGNLRLDTGLIPLDDVEVQFDTCGLQKIEVVASLMNKIVVLYMSWLQGLCLLLTMLSCRYVLDFLKNFKSNGGQLHCTQFTSGIHEADFVIPDTYEHHLVNTVLRAFVAGMCKFTGFTRTVGTSVLYDEEDLSTRSMDLDFLGLVPASEVVKDIEMAIEWMHINSHEELSSTLLDYLSLARSLVSTESILDIHMDIFCADPVDLGFITDALAVLSRLKPETLQNIPTGAFSRFAQLDCNNKHIPNDNFAIDDSEAYTGLKTFFHEVHSFIVDLSRIKNMGQLDSYLRYSVSPKMTSEYNVVARGLFQLFFIRDDKSICGGWQHVTSLGFRFVERMYFGNSLLEAEQWNIQGTPLAVLEISSRCMASLDELSYDLEAAVYQWLSSSGNNRCRQRQLNTRSILTWDSLQLKAETMELEFFNFGIGDKMSPDSSDPALGVSSYVYHTKLGVMLDTALSGFELDLYKVYEALQMYWFAGYLAQMAHDHLVSRVRVINEGKLLWVSSLGKKVKKAKAGPKKEMLKATYRHANDIVAPRVHSNLRYINEYLVPTQLALHLICSGVSHTLSMFEAFGASVDHPKSLADAEKLFKLRMKPWSSVGVPEMPSYSQFRTVTSIHRMPAGLNEAARRVRTLELAGNVKDRFTRAAMVCGGILEMLENRTPVAEDIVFSGGDADIKAWFGSLRKTCVAFQVELGRFVQVVRENSKGSDFRVESRPGYHVFFPLYSMKAKGA